MVVAWRRLALAAGVLSALTGCASVLGSSTSTVQVRTNPDHAHCDLKGRDDFAMAVETPASVDLPGAAAPITVTCWAPGYRATVNTLSASSNGWIWGNSAMIAATGGAAVFGLIVDEALGSGWSYQKDVTYGLDADRPRPIHTRERKGGAQMDLQAR
jgi:uncharacterized protein YceK